MKRHADDESAQGALMKSPKMVEELSGEFSSSKASHENWVYRGSYLLEADEKVPHGDGRKEVIGEGFAASVYEGQFRRGLMWGRGQMLQGDWSSGGTKYVGEWQRNEKHGHGELTSKDGRRYEGQWQHNKWTGKGKLSYPDGRSYDGR